MTNRAVLVALDLVAGGLYATSAACLLAGSLLPGKPVWWWAADVTATAANHTHAALERAHRTKEF